MIFPDDQKKIDELLEEFPKKRELALDLIDQWIFCKKNLGSV